MTKTAEVAHHPALRYIAVYKLAKALLLLLVAGGAFGLVSDAAFDAFIDWARDVAAGHQLLTRWVEALFDFTPSRFALIGTASCVYASVFIAEGWGLWTGKRWAEWLTVIATASLIPFEAWEVTRHVTPLRVGALVANVAIVVYLWRIVRNKT
ncbi:MAG: DUF2127 domain-containing protein [Gammaproteobacteria bacterium]|nr:MAG: DUF2127 domain-containing protein [Gammaproteobacteria bacterium]